MIPEKVNEGGEKLLSEIADETTATYLLVKKIPGNTKGIYLFIASDSYWNDTEIIKIN